MATEAQKMPYASFESEGAIVKSPPRKSRVPFVALIVAVIVKYQYLRGQGRPTKTDGAEPPFGSPSLQSQSTGALTLDDVGAALCGEYQPTSCVLGADRSQPSVPQAASSGRSTRAERMMKSSQGDEHGSTGWAP